jgi:hypothetical protein
MPISLSKNAQRNHLQMPTLEANAGAVAVRDARAPEFDVLDQHLGVAHHPQRLAFGAGPVGKQQRALADAANGQPALRPDHRLLPVLAGQDLDGVAVTRHARRFLMLLTSSCGPTTMVLPFAVALGTFLSRTCT